MSARRGKVVLIIAGAALVLGAVLFPYEAALGYAGHDLLTVRPPSGITSPGPMDFDYFSVSGFDVVAEGTVSFTIEDGSGLPARMAPPSHLVGQEIVRSTDAFWLTRNSTEC